MDYITDAAIATPHWEACETCKFRRDYGCALPCVDLSVFLGDWIICDDYEKNNNYEEKKP
ncbi:MAG: hypothetical protein U9N19_03920 [Thermodesulfobacteriota bacterium]|nr:hypothetical protein [Thermodesulfobacteriota bacterium]